MELERSSGILLHPTSLPGEYGIGTFGQKAYDFVDLLKAAGQKLWQILPLTHAVEDGNSPYICYSAFAGNPLMIDLDKLVKGNLLERKDLRTKLKFKTHRVDFQMVREFKLPLLKQAYDNFRKNGSAKEKKAFAAFSKKENAWLEDYALFMALRNFFGGKEWNDWDKDIKYRERNVLEFYYKELAEEIEYYKFTQYVFFKQWRELKAYANKNGIRIIGDIPIYVSYDSADVWINPEIFCLNKNLKPGKVSGVPPDYFSKNGQLWGNPLYNWKKLKESGYKWWIDRLKFTLELTDIVRLDHFRGFYNYWAVPASQKTARKGIWEKGPGIHFFGAIRHALGELPLIAEDLGLVTKGVENLRKKLNLPGMKVLQFAFEPCRDNVHLPHNYEKNSVAYTGTHDNNTSLGWYEHANDKTKNFLKAYLNITNDDVVWNLIRAAWGSVSFMAIVPLQDLLNLGEDCRMNLPGKTSGNWEWRYEGKMLTGKTLKKLKRLTKIYAR